MLKMKKRKKKKREKKFNKANRYEDLEDIVEIKKIKTEFYYLYRIKITKIYLWFILCNENELLCSFLNDLKIKYACYSIDKKCFLKTLKKEMMIKLRIYMISLI